MVSAPFPTPNNISSLSNLGEYANSLTNNMWGLGILIAAISIMFITLSQRYSTRTSISTTGVFGAIMAILWRFAGQISDFVMFAFIMLGMAGILYAYFVKEEFVE